MRLFEADDYQVLERWFHKRGMKAPPYVYLPKIGFIDDYYAAGFLVQTDTPIAVIDFLISNPSADVTKRGISVSSVIECLIEEAKRRKFKSLKCDSQIPSVGKLAKAFGFTEVGDFRNFYREI